MELDAFNLMQGLGREVALAAMRATHYWHILNDKQACAFPVAPRAPADLGSGLAANITHHGRNRHI